MLDLPKCKEVLVEVNMAGGKMYCLVVAQKGGSNFRGV